MATEKLKRCKLPGFDQILGESIKAGSRKICSETHNLNNPIRNKEQVPQPWGSRSFYLFTGTKTNRL